MSAKTETDAQGTDEEVPNLSLSDIIEGENERGIPIAKFVDDLDTFADSFTPTASAELLIGAYSDLHAKYKAYEMTLTQKRQHLSQKVPELAQSLTLVKSLLQKKEEGQLGMARYSLADNIYARAELDYSEGTVNLWLGANVMLEYTYEEAIEFLSKNEAVATKEFDDVKHDLGFVRDQIVTSEVNMSRIFNWDVRKKRSSKAITSA